MCVCTEEMSSFAQELKADRMQYAWTVPGIRQISIESRCEESRCQKGGPYVDIASAAPRRNAVLQTAHRTYRAAVRRFEM